MAQVADALGTTPQTVRALLRRGELTGVQRPWGQRYVWDVTSDSVEEFLAHHGRYVAGRRSAGTPPEPALDPPIDAVDVSAPPDVSHRPFVLRPRGRATVVVLVLGIPLLMIGLAAQLVPRILWFEEVGQSDVLRRMAEARVDLALLVAVPVVLIMGLDLVVAFRVSGGQWSRSATWLTVVGSLVIASFFVGATQPSWQTFLLWSHRQPFGTTDPVFHRDLGFFVFVLPFEQLVATVLLWLVAPALVCAVLVHLARRTITVRPLRATFGAQVHLAGLVAAGLVVLAWRFWMQRYLLELGQPSPRQPHDFAGASYTDLDVRLPGWQALSVLSVLLAAGFVAAPFAARAWRGRRVGGVLVGLTGLFVVGIGLVQVVIPALVQRNVVDPNPLLSEQPYLERSLAATRSGLGLDALDQGTYAPTGRITAAEFSREHGRLARLPVWDGWLLSDRMRQLASGVPYYRTDDPTFDLVPGGGHQPTPVVQSARELSVPAGASTRGWSNTHLAYTHGSGLLRFSTTAIDRSRSPEQVDPTQGVTEPRIYFGDLSGHRARRSTTAAASVIRSRSRAWGSPWVLVHTRRPEVDGPPVPGKPDVPYHYDGPAGIPLSNPVRRLVFALALGSRQLLLSHDITGHSRILLHRDVHDRLRTLAPFIQWDSKATPLTVGGHIVFVVDGYTTSDDYPSAWQAPLAGTSVSYVRPSVRATVDAFTGKMKLYLVDDSDPLARAWASAFPSLFRAETELPDELRGRLRYPSDLFDTQALAWERFHATAPDVFVSGADEWSRPLALSGPVEVAGGVDFDESDEDDLRLTLAPSTSYAPAPGQTTPRLLLSTYYVPRGSQNLVGTMTGWVDRRGDPHLATRVLPQDPVTLGPAQVSRLVFATPRVSNLLGLRNLEVRDLNVSSLDAVLLGRPRLLLLPGGVVQIQSLYEGSRGAGAARLLGVTAFVNGRAGLGPDIQSAVRQALNQPPDLAVRSPVGPVRVGQPIQLAARVVNARRETLVITYGAQQRQRVLHRAVGRGWVTVPWRPTAAGDVHVRVTVLGLDGTRKTRQVRFSVVDRPPRLAVVRVPRRIEVGRPSTLVFRIAHGRRETATISTRSGVVVQQRYLLQRGTASFTWTPETPGRVVLLLHADGRQGQVTTLRVPLVVLPGDAGSAPLVSLDSQPQRLVSGQEARFKVSGEECTTVDVRITGPDESRRDWRFACPVTRTAVLWTPPEPGSYRFVLTGHGPHSLRTQVATTLVVRKP